MFNLNLKDDDTREYDTIFLGVAASE